RRSARGRSKVLPSVNPQPDQCASCDPATALAYLSVTADDRAKRPGLALLTQGYACRTYARRMLHRRIEATFADTPASRHSGFHRLLAHLAICHNDWLVVHRTDRLPGPESVSGTRVNRLGARVVPVAGEQLPAGARQAAFFRDITDLNQVAKHHTSKPGRSQPL
ncbi:MAG: hypothetical protein FWD74_00695, partial [Actinomycetia bacterium]|nr:hypothetical protein [Actinomycetes bacterium]